MSGESTGASDLEMGVSHLERIAALLANEDFYAVADALGEAASRRCGRPRVYPHWMMLLYLCLADALDNARAVESAFEGPAGAWLREYIGVLVKQQFPDDPGRWPPPGWPCRTAFIKWRNNVPQRYRKEFRERFTLSGIDIARELGLLDPEGPGSPTHPQKSRMIFHDGKVISPLFKGKPGERKSVAVRDAETGTLRRVRRPVPADPDAKEHITGDKNKVLGSKFWHASVRGSERFSRVTLTVDHVPSEKDAGNSEADIAVTNLLDLLPRVPGAIGAISDTALRGTHIDALVRGTGRIFMVPVTAAGVDAKSGQRTEKQRYLRTVTFSDADGTTEDVDIWISGGRLCQQVYADDGTPILVPLKRIANLTRPNDDGTFRTYVQYQVPCPRGGAPKTITEATYQREEDGDFNRPENVRQIPPGDPDYERLKGLRSDAEAANRQIDDHLYLRRARSIGAERQLVDLLAHFLTENSVARYRHRLANGPPQARAA